jgi:hypothetical protein
MRERHDGPNDRSHADLGGSPKQPRESYSDPVTAAPDAPERESVAAAGSMPETPTSAVDAIGRQPSDQGGFGVHRSKESKHASDDASATDDG